LSARIVSDSKAVDTEIVGEKTVASLSRERLAILKALAKEPKYPAELAREMKMPVQTIYYHMHMLDQAGLIKVEQQVARRGAVAKKYALSVDAVSVVFRSAWRPFIQQSKSKIPAIFSPFIANGTLDAKMVLGSPDPHGKYRARGSEYCAAELAMMLGQFTEFSPPLFCLDTEARVELKHKNLILLGGPKVNTVVNDINEHLSIYFEGKTFGICSRLSGKRYEENVGIVEIVENPFNRSKKILLAAGLNQAGTRTAVLALVKELDKISEGNMFDKKQLAHVVQGFDEDGDGIVDTVEILE